ncbi:MAG: aldo/keto reductase [Pyrinomonadaceae bacterium]|nr:aldo/keto reductase [Pyrinomonadaceae bacterium]
MQTRKLGQQGLEVSALGLGCMGMSFAYGPGDDAESLRVLDRALELGVTFWDTAELYGPFKNEELLGAALNGRRREDVIIATKFGWIFGPNGEQLGLDSSPAHIKKALEGSLRRLRTDYVDLYYQHRLDPKTPIEETAGALADLVKEGKVRYIGLSEVGPATIRRAHAVHPLSAIQTEYSLWERSVEAQVLPTVRELGIGFVAYSPMGRGFLTGKINSLADLDESDIRRSHPRFAQDNISHNLGLVEAVKRIASSNKATPAQVALAWLLRKGVDIVPIPGTRHVHYLEENAGAVAVGLTLSEPVWSELDTALSTFETAGDRNAAAAMKLVDQAA